MEERNFGSNDRLSKKSSAWKTSIHFIIICHGFIGSKVGVDRLFVKAAEEFTMDGAIVLRFDFAGCGESSGNYGETGLDAFIRSIASGS